MNTKIRNEYMAEFNQGVSLALKASKKTNPRNYWAHQMEMQAQAAMDAEAMEERQNRRDFQDGVNGAWHASHEAQWNREDEIYRGVRMAIDADHNAKMANSAAYRRSHELNRGFVLGQ